MRTEALLVPPMLAVLCGCTAAHAVKPEDIQQCLNVGQDNGLVMVSTEERSRLLPDLVHQIESSQAMKPNEAPEYRLLLFRSDRKLLLCELGPEQSTRGFMCQLRSHNKPLVPTRTGEAPMLAAQPRRSASERVQ